MEEYIVSARKYRPQTFDDVVGQSALTTTLKNAVKSGKLAHAYLFCGPRGVGKTTCARIFARVINCENITPEGEACGHCESCRAFDEQRSYNIFELDAASNNGVEHIKALMEQTRIPPQVGKYKVFIIDEVHMLSPQAFNSFLKTLEEPPAHVIFILATTEKHKILPTILSRCQQYDFERMTVQSIIDHLKGVAAKEGITYEEQALAVIAEKADGGMRDALSIFDQAASFCQGNITYDKVIEDLNVLDADYYFRIIDLALENKVSGIMVLLNSIIAKGFDPGNLILGLAGHVRNVMMAKDEQTLPLLEVSEQQRRRYQEQAKRCPVKMLYSALRIMNQCDQAYRTSSHKRLLVELTLIQVAQLTQPDDDTPAAGRSPKRLKSLFRRLITSQPKPAAQVAGAERREREEKKEERGERREERGERYPRQLTEKTEGRIAEPAPQKRTISFKKIGIALSDLNRVPENPVSLQDPEVADKAAAEQFTQDELERQWLAMCNRMPGKLSALAQRLKNLTPRIARYPDIELVIDNQILLNQILAIKGRIRATLANALKNNSIQFLPRLTEGEEIRRIRSKPEILADISNSNPAFAQLRKKLKLELV